MISISIRPRIAQGKKVDHAVVGDEEAPRRAIAVPGPEFASVAPSALEDTAHQAAKKN
jgi:hypothetical protein